MKITEEYLRKLEVAPQASRNVRASRGNRTGFVMSTKMGHSIDFESNQPERAAIWLFEHSSEILKFYSQPPAVTLALPDKNGDLRTMPRTFDYATVDADGELTLVECKSVADLKNLSEQNPYRWKEGKDGNWHSPIMEQELVTLGFRFRLVTDRDFSPHLISNLEYLSACPLRVDQANFMHRKIETAVSAGPKPIEELCTICNCTAHDILEAYQLGSVYVDLESSLLARPDLMTVYSNSLVAQAYKATAKTRIPVKGAALVEAGDVIDFDGIEFDVDVVARDTVFLKGRSGKSSLKTYSKRDIADVVAQKNVTLFKQANTLDIKLEVQAMIQKSSPKTLRKALYRAACARGDKPIKGVTVRTLQRWRKKLRESVRFYGVDFALFLEPVRQGNYGRRLSDATFATMDAVMREVYLTKQAPSLSAAYGELLAVCEERSIDKPSYNTFRAYVDSQTAEAEQLRKRLNRRAAYSLIGGTGVNYDPHSLGDYAWHRAHIDAKQLDLLLICPRTGKKLGRPWMTLVIAPKVRMVLGYALTFEPPSANTTLLALRDVYTNWGALPNEIVMDNGKEFKNLAISGIVAAFGTHVTYRPPANPRFGSIIERFFGVFDQRFAHQLAGSTHALSRATGINKENNPANRACWDLGSIDEVIREFIELYHDQVHLSLSISPNEAMEADMKIHPNGTGGSPMNLPYNACKILFLPDTPKGTLKVQGGRGVCYKHHWYWCEEMLQPKVEGQEVEAKYDPYDLSRIYLYVANTWVEAEVRSGPLREILHVLTEWELRYVSRELTGLALKYRSSTERKKVAAVYGAFVRKLRSTEEGKRAALKSQANKANQIARVDQKAAPDDMQRAQLRPVFNTVSRRRVDRSAIQAAPIIKNAQ